MSFANNSGIFFKIMSCIDFFSSKMKVISFFSELNVKSSTDICDQCPGVIAVVDVELRRRLGISEAVTTRDGKEASRQLSSQTRSDDCIMSD